MILIFRSLALCVIPLLSIATAQATVIVSGPQLEIGPSDQINALALHAGAIGTSNVGRYLLHSYDSTQSLMVGEANEVGSSQSLAIGFNNDIGLASYSGWDSAAIGEGNRMFGASSLVIGTVNSPLNGEDNRSYANNVLMVGSYNTGWGESSALVGEQNRNDGSFDSYSGGIWSSMGIGMGITITNYTGTAWSPSFVGQFAIGRYNFHEFSGGPGPVFMVGNGTTSSERANAVEVFYSGKIKITKRQGNVSMGDFGIPE